jgi:hypothetical protein
LPTGADAEWDLVAIGDETAHGVGEFAGTTSSAELYAAHIENDLGVTVNVHDRTVPYVTARRALDALLNRGDDRSLALQGWPDLVREAEVVIFSAGPGDVASETGPILQCQDLVYDIIDCSPETLEAFAADLDGIYEEILRLREGSPTIVRTVEYHAWSPDDWREAGFEDECNQCLDNLNAVIRRTAEQHGVPVAPMHAVINGPNHDQDPREAGYTGETGRLTEAGLQAIADQLRQLGYAPVTQ